jgi:hypothetical protein
MQSRVFQPMPSSIQQRRRAVENRFFNPSAILYGSANNLQAQKITGVRTSDFRGFMPLLDRAKSE